MQFGWTLSAGESFEILDLFVESGGAWIDTADMYGPDQRLGVGEAVYEAVGRAESIVGEWIRTRSPQAKVSVATKVRARTWAGDDGEGLGTSHVVRAVDGSLKRLSVDSIDLYYAHWPDPVTPLEETVGCFDRLVTEGKIRAVGVSNFAPDELRPWLELSTLGGMARPVASQNRYSLLHRASIEQGLSELCRSYDVALFAYSALAAGFLSGKYRGTSPGRSGVRSAYAKQFLSPSGFALLDEVDHVARERGCSMAEVALAWVLHQPAVSGVVIGATSPNQLRALLPAAALRLSSDEVDRLSRSSWTASPGEFTRSRMSDGPAG
jgi:aryl-alcohol dehydrogenase-like predicted oxidoreductase